MAKKAKSQEESGVLRQYEQMKAKHPDAILLFRIGDFYETCARMLIRQRKFSISLSAAEKSMVYELI